MDIWILVICAFVGFFLRTVFGLNPWMLFGSLSLMVLILPVFLFLLPADTEIDRTIKGIAEVYIANLRNCLPSMLIGTPVGIFAREILRLPKVIYDFVRSVL